MLYGVRTFDNEWATAFFGCANLLQITEVVNRARRNMALSPATANSTCRPIPCSHIVYYVW